MSLNKLANFLCSLLCHFECNSWRDTIHLFHECSLRFYCIDLGSGTEGKNTSWTPGRIGVQSQEPPPAPPPHSWTSPAHHSLLRIYSLVPSPAPPPWTLTAGDRNWVFNLCGGDSLIEGTGEGLANHRGKCKCEMVRLGPGWW